MFACTLTIAVISMDKALPLRWETDENVTLEWNNFFLQKQKTKKEKKLEKHSKSSILPEYSWIMNNFPVFTMLFKSMDLGHSIGLVRGVDLYLFGGTRALPMKRQSNIKMLSRFLYFWFYELGIDLCSLTGP